MWVYHLFIIIITVVNRKEKERWKKKRLTCALGRKQDCQCKNVGDP
jgi:hypothetical protein